MTCITKQSRALCRHIAAEHGFQEAARRTILTGLCGLRAEREAEDGTL